MSQFSEMAVEMAGQVLNFSKCVVNDKSMSFGQCYVSYDALVSGYFFVGVLAVYRSVLAKLHC